MNDPFIDSVAFAGAVVAVMVDQRRAVFVASLAVAAGLAPAVAALGGAGAVLVLAGGAVAAGVAGEVTRFLAERVIRRPGTGPPVPAPEAPDALFGPRIVRAFGAIIVLPAASWISFNVPVGSVAVVQGLLFPSTFTFLCGAVRLLLARTFRDLAVGVAVVALAVAAGWFLRGGSDPLPAAAAVTALAPLAAVLAQWLGERRPPQPESPA